MDTATFPSPTAKPSLLLFIQGKLNPDGVGLDDSSRALPDEEEADPGSLRWAAGAQDGVFGHHVGGSEEQDADRIAKATLACLKRPTRRRLLRLYQELLDCHALSVVDPLVDRLASAGVSRDGVGDIGWWLATQGAHREPVKVGIALSGIAGFVDAAPIRQLGYHDEFTLFAVVALLNGFPNPEQEVWRLARSVHGWGRIHCVERLQDTDNAEIRDWILREGFRNSVMYEYLAYIAATVGGLEEALGREDVDRELLTAAGEILQALIRGGPAQNIDDFASAPQTLEIYLDLMHERGTEITDYVSVSEIHDFLTSEEGWGARFSGRWTDDSRDRLVRTTEQILSRREWERTIRLALETDDDAAFHQACAAAMKAGVDALEPTIDRISRDPLGSAWYWAWTQVDAARAESLAAIARESLDLPAIATGPTDAIGGGEGFEHHQALGWTLQGIIKFPGVGGDLVIVGLQSPSTQNRNDAVRVLNAWPRDTWPTGATDYIKNAARIDPNEKTAGAMTELLNRM